MKISLTIFFIFQSITFFFAQNDTVKILKDSIFYRIENGFVTTTEREKAEGFGFKSVFNNFQYENKIYFLQSETPMVVFKCYDKLFINPNTNVESKITLKNGKYEEWYISGEKRVICTYRDDKLDGNFIVLHKNGKVKRLEKWSFGEWQSGECFDENGLKIPYCSYQEQSSFVGGLPKMFEFLSQELKYPKYARKNGIEGTVYIGFAVEKDGSLTDFKVKKGVEKSLNEEALRIAKAMPKWKPGKFEGENVRYEFVLPINFRLE